MVKLELNGAWQMRALNEKEWWKAEVPGSVMSDLLREGIIADPYYRDEQYEVFDRFRADYEYERSFHIDPELLAMERLELVCEGLDTIAEIDVNGSLLACTKNMHRTYRFDVRPLLNAGDNRIRIVFRSPVEYVERKQQESYLWAANDNYVVQGYPHLRKAHHMFGWDWGPKLPDSGIWRDIYIEGAQHARLKDVYVEQQHDTSGQVTVTINTEVEQWGEKEGNQLVLQAALTTPNGETQQVSAAAVSDTGCLQLVVQKPQLWWPNGLGEQPLYKLEVRLMSGQSLIDVKELRIGLRTLTVRNEPDEWGESFEFVVNGRSIFAMGSNYIPEDNIRSKHNRERTERLVQDCVAANFNCIRVWGGGFYPDDYFFDLCDEYGLIVWQDHLFACSEYEMTAEFTEEIKAEVIDNVKRIRHHASLGIWCGNNEMEWAWVDWKFPKRAKLRTDYIKQFEILLPQITKEADPNTFYWLASPSSGGGFDEPNAPHRGDVHYWEVWHGGKPFTEYRQHYFRFCSEFGFQSFPSLKSVEAFTAAGDRNIFTPVMESHQKNEGGNSKILQGVSQHFLYPKDFDSLLYVSQLLQAEAMRYGVEHWRRNRGRCMGSVYWQLNDCWPVASWSSIDYYGRWKALHYSVKRFYAPVLLSAEEEGAAVKLVVTNDTLQPVNAVLKWELSDIRSVVIQSGETEVQVAALSAQPALELDFRAALPNEAALRQHYVTYKLTAGSEVISDGLTLLARPKHIPLEDPQLQVTVAEEEERYVVDVKAEELALFIELSFTELDASLSDNFFHLPGGDTKRIYIAKSGLREAAGVQELRGQLKLRSLYDTYVR
ncbi:glycoside hydrolase family 2 protein [Paenibacillus sp. GCM10023252]|uniref:beta-mannosidase n=1 Tax=Paenibacillus sp. GCM10023252 TaxID=3252649 RepID=UPI00360765A2